MACKVDVHPTLVGLRRILQSQLLTNLLDPRLDLLHMVRAVVTLAHNNVQMRLPSRLCITYPGLENVFGLLYELSMQINGVFSHAAWCVVLAKDVFGGLFVVLIHFRRMFFAFIRQLLRLCAIAALVGLVGLASEKCQSESRSYNNI